MNQRDKCVDPDFELNEFDEEPEIVLFERLPLKVFGTLLLSFGFLLVGWATGSCRFLPGAGLFKMKYTVDPFLYAGLYLFLFHSLLVWPVTHLAYENVRRFPSRILRVLAITLFLAPPVISYIYFISGVREYLDGVEIFLTVVPLAVASALFFEATGSAWTVTALLGVGTLVSTRICNDLMSQFSPLVSYASNGPGFYLLRAIFPIAAVWFAAWQVRTQNTEVGAQTKALKNMREGFLALGAVAIVSGRFLPPVLNYFDKTKTLGEPVLELSSLFCLITFFVLLKPARWTSYAALIIASGEIGYLLFSLSNRFLRPTGGFWSYLLTIEQSLYLGLFVWLAYSLTRPYFRRQFV